MTIIYCGKVNYQHYAPSSIITVIAPDGIRDGNPCVILWQWAVTTAGVPNLNKEFTGKFIEMVAPMVECRNSSDSTHWFTWNLRTNQMLMMSEINTQYGKPITLEKVYPVGTPPRVSISYNLYLGSDSGRGYQIQCGLCDDFGWL